MGREQDTTEPHIMEIRPWKRGGKTEEGKSNEQGEEKQKRPNCPRKQKLRHGKGGEQVEWMEKKKPEGKEGVLGQGGKARSAGTDSKKIAQESMWKSRENPNKEGEKGVTGKEEGPEKKKGE